MKKRTAQGWSSPISGTWCVFLASHDTSQPLLSSSQVAHVPGGPSSQMIQVRSGPKFAVAQVGQVDMKTKTFIKDQVKKYILGKCLYRYVEVNIFQESHISHLQTLLSAPSHKVSMRRQRRRRRGLQVPTE